LGRALMSAAHCASLRRLSSGPATVDGSVSVSALEPGSIVDGRVSLHAPLAFLEPMAHVPLDASSLDALGHGRAIAATHAGARAAMLRDGEVVGIADRVVDPSGARWQPRVVLLSSDA
jgi:tRNA U55 pseudouridine synthase TruB